MKGPSGSLELMQANASIWTCADDHNCPEADTLFGGRLQSHLFSNTCEASLQWHFMVMRRILSTCVSYAFQLSSGKRHGGCVQGMDATSPTQNNQNI